MTRKNAANNRLYAFVDNELNAAERAALLGAMLNNKALEERVNRLRRIKDLVALAHQEPPLPTGEPSRSQSHRRSLPFCPLLATVVVFVVSAVLGWMSYAWLSETPRPVFLELAQLDAKKPASEKVLLHISDMKPRQIERTLDTIEKLLASSHRKGRKIQVEVVTNADGLDLLRLSSPYAARISAMASAYSSISFLACGAAMQNAALEEGGEIQLIPEAIETDTALGEILKRLEQGWSYVHS